MTEMISPHYVLRAYIISLIQGFIELRLAAQETSKGISLAEHFPLKAHHCFFCEVKEKILPLH